MEIETKLMFLSILGNCKSDKQSVQENCQQHLQKTRDFLKNIEKLVLPQLNIALLFLSCSNIVIRIIQVSKDSRFVPSLLPSFIDFRPFTSELLDVSDGGFFEQKI